MWQEVVIGRGDPAPTCSAKYFTHTKLYLLGVIKTFRIKRKIQGNILFFTKKHKNYLIIVIINLTSTIYLCYNTFYIIFIYLKVKKYVHKS